LMSTLVILNLIQDQHDVILTNTELLHLLVWLDVFHLGNGLILDELATPS
jgi:hypothetical protein